jgi:hypothetical protein
MQLKCNHDIAPFVLLICLVLASASGCGSYRDPNLPKVVRATGTVSYKGKAISGVDVVFNNEASKRSGYARTDQQGHFVLTTFEQNDGVVPGSQSVTLRRVDVTDSTPEGVDVTAGGKAGKTDVRWIIPEIYSNPQKSGLKVEVTEKGPNDFKFDLK